MMIPVVPLFAWMRQTISVSGTIRRLYDV